MSDVAALLHGWELPSSTAPDAAYAAVRTACDDANFTEAAICERFNLAAISEFSSLREGRAPASRYDDALEVFTDLFLDLAPVPVSAARALLGETVVDALRHLDLVYRDDADETNPHLLARMLMYPTAGVILTSDRTFARPGEQIDLPPDIVYPAITRTTSTFVRMLLPSPCNAFLELCAGNGIAALAMGPVATHSWSLDITERATQVATFNARLNSSTNVTVACGDLFAPVAGLTFDRIAAHPPYVPSSTQSLVYRDGGTDGELITRRIVNELPAYLRPGGRFTCTCVATDRMHAPLEQRIREWLGDDRDEFDVIVAVTSAVHPSEYYFKSAMHGKITFAEAEQRHLAMKDMEVEQMVYSSFVIERHRTSRPTATVRIHRSAETSGRELEQFCDWLTRREDGDFRDRLLAARPRISSRATLHTTRQLAGEKWKDGEQEFRTEWPFIATVQCPDDVAFFLARCDGTRSVRQLIAWLRQRKLLAGHVRDDAVLQMVAQCAAAGALHLQDEEPRGE